MGVKNWMVLSTLVYILSRVGGLTQEIAGERLSLFSTDNGILYYNV